MLSTIAPIIALLSSQALAHGVVTSIEANGVKYPGYSSDFKYQANPPAVVGWTADVESRGPVMDVTSPDIICHKSATNAKLSAEVAAGSKVKLQWTVWPDSHKGPVMDYLADCGGDCSTVDKTALKFFKIDAAGMTGATGIPANYADDDMIKAGNVWEVTIPATIKPGNYVLRHETIALHEGQRVGGAQLYPQCFNLKVTGSGTASPPGVLGTSIYKADEPGVVFDIYKKYTSTADYPIPGPPVWDGATTGGSAPAPAAPAPATPSNVASPATTKPGGSYAENPSAAAPSAAAPSAAAPSAAAPKPSAAPIVKKPKGSCKKQQRRHARDVRA